MGRLAVTVPVLNQYGWTSCICHELFIKTANPCPKIIVDNASTEGNLFWLYEKIDGKNGFMVVRNETNRGVSGAWNQAVEIARQIGVEFLSIMNNDLVLPRAWDEIMLEPFENPNVDVTSISPGDKPFFCPFCFTVRMSLFDRIGLFDETIGLYGGEDIDFMLRMKEAGIKFVNIRAAKHPEFFHAGSQSCSELFDTEDEHRKFISDYEIRLRNKWSQRLGLAHDFNIWDYIAKDDRKELTNNRSYS